MSKDTVTLTIDKVIGCSTARGYLHVYRELDHSEIETEVDIEFDMTPYEPETLESPRVDAEVEITEIVDSKTGKIEYNLDAIDNLSDAGNAILEADCE